eukprot:scaffold4120_cov400-Prasinococcus_capsulatus_cf.AAC.28
MVSSTGAAYPLWWLVFTTLIVTWPFYGEVSCDGVRHFPTWRDPEHSLAHLHGLLQRTQGTRRDHSHGAVRPVHAGLGQTQGVDGSLRPRSHSSSHAVERRRKPYGSTCSSPPWEKGIRSRPRQDVSEGAPPSGPHVQWVVRHKLASQYTHMAMVAQLSNGSLVVAYQAAQFAEEGGSEQHIQLVVGDLEAEQPSASYNLVFQVRRSRAALGATRGARGSDGRDRSPARGGVGPGVAHGGGLGPPAAVLQREQRPVQGWAHGVGARGRHHAGRARPAHRRVGPAARGVHAGWRRGRAQGHREQGTAARDRRESAALRPRWRLSPGPPSADGGAANGRVAAALLAGARPPGEQRGVRRLAW